jgi:hypothetical protein
MDWTEQALSLFQWVCIIVETMQPFTAVEHPAFKTLFNDVSVDWIPTHICSPGIIEECFKTQDVQLQ